MMQKWSERVLLAVSVFIVGLAAVYAFAAHPILDDFCFSATHLSPFDHANALYLDWSGRWLAMFLYTAAAQHDQLDGALSTVFSLLSIVSWIAAFALIADRAFPHEARGRRLAIGVILFAAFWAFARGIGETVYWTGGFFSYPLPFLFAAIAFHQIHRRAWLAALSVAAAASCNELAGIALTAWLGVDAIGTRRRDTMIVLAFALASTLVNILAPGTGARAAQAPQALSLAKIAFNLVRPYESGIAVLLAPIVLLAGLAAAGTSKAPAPRWWLPLFAAGAAVLVGNAAYVVGVGTTPTVRVLDFLLAIALAGAVFGGASAAPLPDRTRPIFISLLVAMLVTAPNVARAIHYLPSIPAWKAEHRALRSAAAKGTDVVASDYSTYPPFFLERQLPEDPQVASNRCLATRWGLRSIRSAGHGVRWEP